MSEDKRSSPTSLAHTGSRCREAALPARASSPGKHMELQQHEAQRTASWPCTGLARNIRAVKEAKCSQAPWLGAAPLLHPAFPAAVRNLSGKSPFACPAHPQRCLPPAGEPLLNRLFHKHPPEEGKASRVNETGSPELQKMLAQHERSRIFKAYLRRAARLDGQRGSCSATKKMLLARQQQFMWAQNNYNHGIQAATDCCHCQVLLGLS